MTRARILADYVAGGTTAAEFDYLDGVTSNVQTQMDAKAPLASPTFTGNFTSVGIDDNADATAITIDSSERVGIGSSAGAQNVQADRLVVGDGTGDEGITIYSGAGSGDTGNLFFADSGNAVQGGISYDQGDNKMLFRVNDANRMTIDTSGRVIMKAQPMMLATGVNAADPALTTSWATITFLSASSTTCFIRGITYSNGVATVPIAGRYWVSVSFLVISLTAGDQVSIKLVPSVGEYRSATEYCAHGYHWVTLNAIFDMDASETLTLQMANQTSSRGSVSNAKATARWSMVYLGE